jgi:hypothetical protein
MFLQVLVSDKTLVIELMNFCLLMLDVKQKPLNASETGLSYSVLPNKSLNVRWRSLQGREEFNMCLSAELC